MTDESYKAHAFAAFANTTTGRSRPGLSPTATTPTSAIARPGWTVIARRGSDVITATWIDEVAIGPIGWHSTPSSQRPIPNQASVRRIIES